MSDSRMVLVITGCRECLKLNPTPIQLQHCCPGFDEYHLGLGLCIIDHDTDLHSISESVAFWLRDERLPCWPSGYYWGYEFDGYCGNSMLTYDRNHSSMWVCGAMGSVYHRHHCRSGVLRGQPADVQAEDRRPC